MNSTINYIVYIIVRAFFGLISLIPHKIGVPLIALIVRFVLFLLPKYRDIARRNLELAFPEMSREEHEKIIKDSYRSLARLIVDFARFRRFTPEWITEHIEFPPEEILEKVRSKVEGKPGILFATGHLGSFELLAYGAALQGFPMGFVVRNFKNERLDKWWNGQRKKSGNKVIPRKGAFKVIFEMISKGEHVGILFDQNVTLKHAVFVNFFGRPAATTRTIGLVAARTEAPVMVVSMTHKGNDYYKINLKECDFTELYQNVNMDIEEKVLKITQHVSSIYEDMIRMSPGEWFWLHRRWKTAPLGYSEDFYTRSTNLKNTSRLVSDN